MVSFRVYYEITMVLFYFQTINSFNAWVWDHKSKEHILYNFQQYLYRPDPTRSDIYMFLWSFLKSSGGWLVWIEDWFERLEPLLDVFGSSERSFDIINKNDTVYMISNSISTIQIRPEVI